MHSHFSILTDMEWGAKRIFTVGKIGVRSGFMYITVDMRNIFESLRRKVVLTNL